MSVHNLIPNLAALQLLYSADPETVRSRLPAISEQLSTQLSELYRAPDPVRCEDVVTQLHGAMREVQRLQAALLATSRNPEPPQAA